MRPTHVDAWVWLVMAAPFLVGALLGTITGYLVRAERASRELWAADQREAEWRRELVRTRPPRHAAPPRQRRPQPYATSAAPGND
ncbi:MAG: hypothetical protein WCA46_28180 [Actinocatenispora sp.]